MRQKNKKRPGAPFPAGEFFDVTIIREHDDARDRLAEFGLTVEILTEALKMGEAGRNARTLNDTRPACAMTPWNDSTRGLRDQLIHRGWYAKEQVLSLTINPDGWRAFVFATGTDATGQRHLVPTTKWPKGAATARAVEKNGQLALIPDALPSEEEQRIKAGDYELWMILFRRKCINFGAIEAPPLGNDIGIDEVDEDAAETDEIGRNEVDTSASAGYVNANDHAEVNANDLRTVIFCEVSLPSKIEESISLRGTKTYTITEWSERILLPMIDLSGPSAIERQENDADNDLEIEVVRKMG
jgi:hypothetical protein